MTKAELIAMARPRVERELGRALTDDEIAEATVSENEPGCYWVEFPMTVARFEGLSGRVEFKL